jgi:AcrR family transcriptional regulator
MMEAAEPRKRNAGATRDRILAAAQRAFSVGGYDQTGIRDIAAIAEVSSTLLLRYFGSKAGLFEAAMTEAVRLDAIFAEGRAHFGTHVAALLLREDLDVKPPVLIAISAGDPQAREITARVTEAHVIAPLAEWLGPPDARARAEQITMLATGFVIYARQLPLRPTAGTDPAVLAWFAGSLQAIVDRS